MLSAAHLGDGRWQGYRTLGAATRGLIRARRAFASSSRRLVRKTLACLEHPCNSQAKHKFYGIARHASFGY